jgi:hypothetical protein
MPLFDYIGPDGKVREILDPVGPPQIVDEWGVVWHRSEVQSFALGGFKKPESQGDQVLKGYHEQECLRGSRFHTIHHPETIKRAWKNDTLPAVA